VSGFATTALIVLSALIGVVALLVAASAVWRQRVITARLRAGAPPVAEEAREPDADESRQGETHDAL